MVLLCFLVLPGVFRCQPAMVVKKYAKFQIEQQNHGGFSLHSSHVEERTVFSERAKDQFRFHLMDTVYSRVSDIYGIVDGRPTKPNFRTYRADWEDTLLSDVLVHEVNFAWHASLGQPFRLEYNVAYEDLAFHPVLRIPNVDRLESYVVEWRHPLDISIRFEGFFPYQSLKVDAFTPEPGKTILQVHPLPKYSLVDYLPFPDLGYIKVIISDKTEDHTRSTPAAFSQWYRDKNGIPEITPDLLRARLPDFWSPEGRGLEGLHQWVTQNLRYVADERQMGAFIPRTPQEVLDRGYADCKDRAALIAAIGRSQGIETAVALISTEVRPAFKGIGVHDFNHAIYAVHEKGKWRFEDPTAITYAFGDVPEYLIGQPALILASTGAFSMPVPDVDPTRQFEIFLKVDLAFPFKAHADIILARDFAAAWRRHKMFGDSLESQQALSEILRPVLPRLRFFGLDDESDEDGRIHLHSQVDASRLFVTSERNVLVSLAPFSLFKGNMMARAGDRFPLFVDQRPNYRFEMEVTHPHRLLEDKPLEFKAGDDRFFFSVNEVAGREKTVFAFEVGMQPRIILDSEKPGFLNVLNQVYALRSQKAKIPILPETL